MRYWLLVVAVLVLLGAGGYGLGMLLPENVVTQRIATYSKPVETVWNTLTDMPDMPKWHPYIDKTEKTTAPDGREAWKVSDKNGHFMVLEQTEVEQPARFVSRVVDTNMSFTGDWVFELQPATDQNEGTVLKITEHASVQDPMMRFMSHYILGTNHEVDKFLEALGKRFGAERVRITD